WLFGRHTGRGLFQVTDFLVPLTPLGLGFGRLGNFANTELPGRETDSAFGLIYPCSADAVRALNPLCTGQWESFARHPSPLYQAFAEGVVLFVVLWWFASKPRAYGAVSGAFLVGYGLLRIVTEFFREPDAHLGFVFLDAVSMGQLLSLPMVLLGLVLISWHPARRDKANTV
ncbi:MAG: prolipoprotein diacylglyceryl transferase, partial [Pseudomonadota bacterium]